MIVVIAVVDFVIVAKILLLLFNFIRILDIYIYIFINKSLIGAVCLN